MRVLFGVEWFLEVLLVRLAFECWLFVVLEGLIVWVYEGYLVVVTFGRGGL